MFKSAGLGAVVALAAGFFVGLWAAIVQAPPEATAGVASALGGALGLLTFGTAAASRFLRRRAAPARRGERKIEGLFVDGAAQWASKSFGRR